MTVPMTWLALFSLTALVLLLPMLPALREWRRPRDATPLHIDAQDALDPDLLARRFADRLAQALREGADHLNDQPLVRLAEAAQTAGPAGHPWPLTADEQARGRSQRLWSAAGSVQLPAHIAFHAEVAADDDLRSAEGATYRALLAGRQLWLAEGSQVLRWAHGHDVVVAEGAAIHGRCTAQQRLTLLGQARFQLLHAPLLQFGAPLPPEPEVPAVLPQPDATLPIEWHAGAGRGVAHADLRMPPRHGWQGDLVGMGQVQLGEGCHARGSLKARRTLTAGAGTRIDGHVIAEGAIELGEGCLVQGVVASETAVRLGRGCRIGLPGRPATVTAPHIEVAEGVVVHGTVWAGEQGLALGGSTGAALATPVPPQPAMSPTLPPDLKAAA